MDWTAGYNTSVAYTTGYYQEQSPSFLNACLVMQGVSPPSIEKFTYCELGFGQGLTSLILAATHPGGDFYACDFNPAHVMAATSVRDEAGLPNLTILGNDFTELAQGKVELPQFDYITMHGIISWVSNETRAQILQFVRQYLKPGGVVQVSYNAMAGCAQILPLQRLLMLGAKMSGDGWTGAAALVKKLVEANALHFKHNPDSSARISEFENLDPRYLVHEYLQETWTPFFFADIAREMAEAKLSFAGSASFANMAPVEWLTQAQRELVESVDDPVAAEELRDYCANHTFRKDVFIRGKVLLTANRLRDHAEHIHLWGNPAATYVPVVQVEHASITRGGELNRALFDFFRGTEMTLAQLIDAPRFADVPFDLLMNTLRLSIAVGETSIRYGAIQPRAAAERLNSVLLSRAERGEVWNALASPRLGGGEGVGTFDQLLLASFRGKPDRIKAMNDDMDELIARVKRSLAATGLRLRIGKIEVPAEDIEMRLGHIFADSGKKLIAHAETLGFWVEPQLEEA
jgi:SAM-dependent methyltransferase